MILKDPVIKVKYYTYQRNGIIPSIAFTITSINLVSPVILQIAGANIKHAARNSAGTVSGFFTASRQESSVGESITEFDLAKDTCAKLEPETTKENNNIKEKEIASGPLILG